MPATMPVRRVCCVPRGGVVGGRPPGCCRRHAGALARQSALGVGSGQGTRNLARLRRQHLGKFFGIGVLQVIDVDLPPTFWGRHVEFGNQILDRRQVRTRGNEHQGIRPRVWNDPRTTLLGALAGRRLAWAAGCAAPAVVQAARELLLPLPPQGSRWQLSPSIAERSELAICSAWACLSDTTLKIAEGDSTSRAMMIFKRRLMFETVSVTIRLLVGA